ncbi:hypothetical protein [Lutimaribacter saemankumensis]|nr:hypothetical protein [Lutimaribacter saemankumensis]
MKTVRILAAMGIIAAIAGCSVQPETSSRFQFSPAQASLLGID